MCCRQGAVCLPCGCKRPGQECLVLPRRVRVHCHGSQCDAELQGVRQLPGVSAALDQLTSSASVAGAPVRRHQDGRYSHLTTIENRRWECSRWPCGRQSGLEAGVGPGFDPGSRISCASRLRRCAEMCRRNPGGTSKCQSYGLSLCSSCRAAPSLTGCHSVHFCRGAAFFV